MLIQLPWALLSLLIVSRNSTCHSLALFFAREAVQEQLLKPEPRRALLIQTAFIKDVVLTTPMFRAFKKSFPNTYLCVLVRPEAAALLHGHAFVDELFVIDKKGKDHGLRGSLRIIRKLRSGNFDLLLSPQPSYWSGLLAVFSAIPSRFGYASHILARLAYHHCVRGDRSHENETEGLLSLLEVVLGYYGKPYHTEKFDLRPCIYARPEELSIAKDLLREKRALRPFVLAPSSFWPTQRWPPWYFAVLTAKLIRQYRRKVFLVGEVQDREVNVRVMYYIKHFQLDWVHEDVHDISGRLSLQGLYALLSLSSLLISNDSAPAHLGCAAGIPVVAIFGSTAPTSAYAPLPLRFAAAQKKLSCRPCAPPRDGYRRCPQKHFRCMKELSPLDVLKEVRKVLA